MHTHSRIHKLEMYAHTPYGCVNTPTCVHMHAYTHTHTDLGAGLAPVDGGLDELHAAAGLVLDSEIQQGIDHGVLRAGFKFWIWCASLSDMRGAEVVGVQRRGCWVLVFGGKRQREVSHIAVSSRESTTTFCA